MQALRPRGAISMQEFRGRLYVGTDRPTELIRINPDQSWDLVVGPPRMTASGFKWPLSGITGKGFNSAFNGHFYSMAVHDGTLYLCTWDWSQILQGTPLDGLFRFAYGFDFFRSRDGVHWTVIDRNGFGDPYNSSIRNLESTPSASSSVSRIPPSACRCSEQVAGRCGRDHDDRDHRDCDRHDRHRRPASPRPGLRLRSRGWDHDDGDHDDGRERENHCRPRDARQAKNRSRYPPGGWRPRRADPRVVLRWSAVRSDPVSRTAHPLTLTRRPATATVTLPDRTTLTVEQIRNGALDELCQNDAAEAGACALVEAIQSNTLGSKPFRWIGSTRGRTFVEQPPGPALYYVAAQDKRGRISPPTNVVEVLSPGEGEAEH
jgi:hypothetical protein